MRHLCKGRLKALSVRMHADAQFEPAAFLPRTHRGDADCGNCTAQRFRIVAAVKLLFGNIDEGHLFGRSEYFCPHLMRLDTDFMRDGIEDEFEREADSGTR